MTLTIPLWIFILIGIMLVFLVGVAYGQSHNERAPLLKIAVGAISALFSLLALFGAVFLLIPDWFSKISSALPAGVSDWLTATFVFGSLSGFIVYAVIAGLLWWVFSRLK